MAPGSKVPDRWLDYTPMGERIPGTRFICMKVPLREYFLKDLEDHEKFNCTKALETAGEKGHNLGLVIDLSYSRKYYDPMEFESKNVLHKKIYVPGQQLPPPSIVDEFSNAVTKFERENEHNDDLIAVHCTHGLNRTGYIVCRHLIDRKLFNPQDAIEAFNKARGHSIEREAYVQDLLSPPGQSQRRQEDRRRERTRNRRRESDNYFEKPKPLWRERGNVQLPREFQPLHYGRSYGHQQFADCNSGGFDFYDPYRSPPHWGMYGGYTMWRGPYARPQNSRPHNGTHFRTARGRTYY